MFNYLNSKKGEVRVLSVIIVVIILIAIFILVQWSRTKVKIEAMESKVRTEARGSRGRPSWNKRIYENILKEAEDIGLIEYQDITDKALRTGVVYKEDPDTGEMYEAFAIEIYRPRPKKITITVYFQITTNFLLSKKVDDIEISESADIYIM